MRYVAALCGLILASASAYGQGGGNAAITGTVKDTSGAVIAGASVTATQEGTGVKRSVVTNASGDFNVPSLPPSAYRITVEAKGFKTYVEQTTLLADRILGLQVQLQVGQAAETITVEGSAAQVDTVSPVISQVIEQSRAVDLPLNGRNAADLTTLAAGTENANGHGVQQGSTKQIPGTESISINGARPDQISYNLDGATNEDLLANTNNPFPFPDALQEFSVQTNSFDTQYGTNAGGVVNVVTKSGTNSFHGDAFEFVRNRAFNARPYFANVVDPLKRNQYGATIGGPIVKDHTFFFFGYQGTQVRTQNSANNTILPTQANLTGDFSNYLSANPGVNPLGKVIQINNPATGSPFPGDMIPASMVNPVAVNMSKFLPISQAAANGRITFQTPDIENTNEFVGRIDQTVRGQDKLFFRFDVVHYYLAPPYNGQSLLTVGTGSTVQTMNYALGYTWIISPTLVNNLVADVVRSASDRTQGGNVPQFSDFGAVAPQLPKAQGGIRGFGIQQGYFGIGNFTDGAFVRNTGEIRDHATWTRGRHTIDFGGNFERDQSNIRNTDLENGSWNFASNLSGLALANFVIGHMSSYSQTSGNYSDQRENVIGVYVADKWKVLPTFTLTMGLRWEPQAVMKEIFGRTEQFWPNAYASGIHSTVIPTAPVGLFFPGDCYSGQCMPSTGENADLNNFAPRLGFAWDVFGTGKTVIRSGGGVFYSSRLPGLFLNDASISQPFSLRTDISEPGNTPNSLIPFNNPLQSNQAFAAAFPSRYVLATVPKNVQFIGADTAYGLEPFRKWVTPTTYDWNFTIEHQLRPDTLISASYIGLRANHLRQDVNLNPRAVGVGTDASRYYKGYLNILENQNNGMSDYNSLQLGIQKRPTAGSRGIMGHVTLLANYTFSKAMDIALASAGGITDVGSSVGSGMPYGNPNQGHFDTGPSDFDRTHKFVASYVWDLPRLRTANTFVRAIVGGWEWTGIFTHLSGDAMTILAGTDRSLTGLGGDRGQFIGSASQYGGISSLQSGCGAGACVPWMNTSLFVLPAIGTFGNIGKGAFRGPGLTNLDMGLFKDFTPLKAHEDIRMQLRGEFFDVLNHPSFADPTLNVNDGNFGGIRGTVGGPRIIQLAVKVFF